MVDMQAFGYQYETWSVAGGNISKGALGNKDLKPQTTTETEVGLDFTIMDLVSVELTQSTTINEDQLYINEKTKVSIDELRTSNTNWLNNYMSK